MVAQRKPATASRTASEKPKKKAPPGLLAFKWGPDNPPPRGGRPKIPSDIKAAFRELTPQAIETLKRVMESKDLRAATQAASTVLDRAWGKATIFLEGELRVATLSEEERKAKVAELLAKVQARALEAANTVEGEVVPTPASDSTKPEGADS
jgi:sulfur carrier protein ThiS